MARKREETFIERFAVMKLGHRKKEVKAWQYYSVYDYCRSAGLDKEESARVAKWCREKAKAGDAYTIPELTIQIVEKELKA